VWKAAYDRGTGVKSGQVSWGSGSSATIFNMNNRRFVTIADNELMSLKRFDQTQAGFITLFAEKRVCSTILDVFAGVRLVG
jgi:hypothetical protein